MTKEDLSQHMELRKRMANALELLASLEAAASPRAQHLDGMPHASGISDRTGDLAAEIADAKAVINGLQAEVIRSETVAAAWIATIDDMQTRMIFRLRYIRGLPWKEVAALVGGGNTDRSVRLRAYRYEKAHLEGVDQRQAKD